VPAIVAPNEGLSRLLLYIVQAEELTLFPWQALLFTNDITPTQATVLADLTEVTWTGYTRLTLDPTGWTAPAIDSGQAVSEWGLLPNIWTNGGGPTETVYGYAIVDTLAGVIRFVQRFDSGDIRAVPPGESVAVLPRITLGTQAP